MDPVTNERYIPYCIEPSVGVDRILLAFLVDAFHVEELENNDKRNVLKLHPQLAPIKVAVLPLTKKLKDKAWEVYQLLSKEYMTEYDETGSIGKRYRRQDEIGTPYCITIDFDTLEDDSITIRDRDTMEQIRLPIHELKGFLNKKFVY